MPASIREVARLAGVSTKTVSNVVHDFEHVRPSTRARVERAIAELGYRPNLSARHLRRGRVGMIAVALPQLVVPYFVELASALVAEAATHGYAVLIDQTGGDLENELHAARGLRDHRVDGLILSPLALGPDHLRERDPSLPLVLLGEQLSAAAADHVAIDNVAAAARATAHLTDLGRTRIALLGAQDPEVSHMALLRERGFRQALVQADLPYHPELRRSTPWFLRDDGLEGMRRLLDSGARPDAVFCMNDLLAIGAIKALHERGVRVPDDVAVVGIDNIEEGRYQLPTLTSIAPDKAQIARLAVERLLARMGPEREAPSREFVADHHLEIRGSTVSDAPSGTTARSNGPRAQRHPEGTRRSTDR